MQEERFLKRYLEYSRARCCPRLSEKAAETLVDEYVQLRRSVRLLFCCLGSAALLIGLYSSLQNVNMQSDVFSRLTGCLGTLFCLCIYGLGEAK